MNWADFAFVFASLALWFTIQLLVGNQWKLPQATRFVVAWFISSSFWTFKKQLTLWRVRGGWEDPHALQALSLSVADEEHCNAHHATSKCQRQSSAGYVRHVAATLSMCWQENALHTLNKKLLNMKWLKLVIISSLLSVLTDWSFHNGSFPGDRMNTVLQLSMVILSFALVCHGLLLCLNMFTMFGHNGHALSLSLRHHNSFLNIKNFHKKWQKSVSEEATDMFFCLNDEWRLLQKQAMCATGHQRRVSCNIASPWRRSRSAARTINLSAFPRTQGRKMEQNLQQPFWQWQNNKTHSHCWNPVMRTSRTSKEDISIIWSLFFWLSLGQVVMTPGAETSCTIWERICFLSCLFHVHWIRVNPFKAKFPDVAAEFALHLCTPLDWLTDSFWKLFSVFELPAARTFCSGTCCGPHIVLLASAEFWQPFLNSCNSCCSGKQTGRDSSLFVPSAKLMLQWPFWWLLDGGSCFSMRMEEIVSQWGVCSMVWWGVARRARMAAKPIFTTNNKRHWF